MSELTYRIGLIYDWATGTRSIVEQHNMMRILFDEAHASGLIDKPVEAVVREVEMHPIGTSGMVAEAYLDLARNEGVLACIGPHITDICKALWPLIDQEKVPAISHTATANWPSEYCFLLPNGTFGDEMGMEAQLIAKDGSRKLGLLVEANPIGDEYGRFLRIHCKRLGVPIVHQETLTGRQDEAEIIPHVEKLREAGVDALYFGGFGARSDQVLKAVNKVVSNSQGWSPKKYTVTIFPRLTTDFGFFDIDIEDWEGWIGLDQIDERNPISRQALDKYQAHHGTRPLHCYTLIGYDMANVLCHALSMANPKTPEGVKQALERIRNLPAATGGPENYISFGPWDHRGYTGPDYVLHRTVRGGENRVLQAA